MIIKDKFTLLKNTPNLLSLSDSSINAKAVKDGTKKVYLVLKMEKKLTHFSKDKIIKLTNMPKSEFVVTTMDNYPLPVTYNTKTKQTIINVDALGTDDISSTSPDPRTLLSSQE